MKHLSWKPRLRGAVYYSPACGHDCTRKEYDRARARAAKIAGALGKGWKPSVWENMGWHSEAKKGRMSVSFSDIGIPHYLAQTGERGILGDGSTPLLALKAMQIRLQSEVDAASELLDEVNIG